MHLNQAPHKPDSTSDDVDCISFDYKSYLIRRQSVFSAQHSMINFDRVEGIQPMLLWIENESTTNWLRLIKWKRKKKNESVALKKFARTEAQNFLCPKQTTFAMHKWGPSAGRRSKSIDTLWCCQWFFFYEAKNIQRNVLGNWNLLNFAIRLVSNKMWK